MVLNLIREKSLNAASRLGFAINKALPLLDEVQATKSAEEVVKRLLCLHATAACSYGFDRNRAQTWLEQEDVWNDLVAAERQFIAYGDGDPNQFKVQIEGMWALAWALWLTPHLDFGKNCDSNFVAMLPNLRVDEKSEALFSRVKLRETHEILAACDLAYCLHWAIREAQQTGNKPPGKVQPYVIIERRRALEWLLSKNRWDQISLDT